MDGEGGREGSGRWRKGFEGDGGERTRADMTVCYRFRARATKKMTVELAEQGEGQGAFAWPEEPKDSSPYAISPLPYSLSLSPLGLNPLTGTHPKSSAIPKPPGFPPPPPTPDPQVQHTSEARY